MDIYNGILEGLIQALACQRGDISLPSTTYKTVWPDCPFRCSNIDADGDCNFKQRCFVRIDDNDGHYIGDPTEYLKGQISHG